MNCFNLVLTIQANGKMVNIYEDSESYGYNCHYLFQPDGFAVYVRKPESDYETNSKYDAILTAFSLCGLNLKQIEMEDLDES